MEGKICPKESVEKEPPGNSKEKESLEELVENDPHGDVTEVLDDTALSKRLDSEDASIPSTQGEAGVNTTSDKKLKDLQNEKEKLNPRCLHTIRLLEEEIQRLTNQDQGDRNVTNQEISIDDNECVDLSEKVFFPTDDYPNHNFVTNLLGPQGFNLRNVASYTMTKISILGKGSTRNKFREEELSKSSDPIYAHFKEQLHVLIEANGPKHSAESRLTSAVSEIKRYLQEEITKLQIPPDPYETRRPFDNDPHTHVNLREKVVVPVKENDAYQFTSKLLGPRGSNLRSICMATKTKISILGRGSLRDKTKEESLSKSNDPNHQHLKEPLYVAIQVAGPRQQAQARLNAALREIKMYIDEEVNQDEPKSESSTHSKGLSGYFEESVHLTEKIFLPVDKYPSNNFVGKLLGPGGSNLRKITASTQTRISILGKSSIKDKSKEEELVKSDDPKYEHLKEPLHVLIQVAGPKYAVQGRLNDAVAEVRRHIDEEINRITPFNSSSTSSQERRPFDNDEFVRLHEKVFFPVSEYPSYNFIGRLLGSKGSNLKSIIGDNISSTTKTKISIMGKGSTRNSKKEEELSKSNDVRHQHFKEPLHVEIEVTGPKYSAQVRLKSVVAEIEQYADPKNDDIRRKQSETYTSMSNPFGLSKSTNQEDLFISTKKLYDNQTLSPSRDTKTDYNTRGPDHKTSSTNYSYDKETYACSNDYNYEKNSVNNVDYSYQRNSRTYDDDNHQQTLSTNYNDYTQRKEDLNVLSYSKKKLSSQDNYASPPEKRYKNYTDNDQYHYGDTY